MTKKNKRDKNIRDFDYIRGGLVAFQAIKDQGYYEDRLLYAIKELKKELKDIRKKIND